MRDRSTRVLAPTSFPSERTSTIQADQPTSPTTSAKSGPDEITRRLRTRRYPVVGDCDLRDEAFADARITFPDSLAARAT